MDSLDEIVQDSENKSQLIENINQSRDIEFLNAGNDRVVGMIGNQYVAKFELTPRQNKKEYQVFNQHSDLQDYLLPIEDVSEGKKWITYPVIQFNVGRQEKKQFLKEIVDEHGLFPRDFKIDDIGKYNGQLVICDYGFGFKSVDPDTSSIENLMEPLI